MQSADDPDHAHQDAFALKDQDRPALVLNEVRRDNRHLLGVLMQNITIHLCLGKLLPHHHQGRHIRRRGRSDYTSCSHDMSRLYCIVVPPALA